MGFGILKIALTVNVRQEEVKNGIIEESAED
jgi:hypothetical protein